MNLYVLKRVMAAFFYLDIYNRLSLKNLSGLSCLSFIFCSKIMIYLRYQEQQNFLKFTGSLVVCNRIRILLL